MNGPSTPLHFSLPHAYPLPCTLPACLCERCPIILRPWAPSGGPRAEEGPERRYGEAVQSHPQPWYPPASLMRPGRCVIGTVYSACLDLNSGSFSLKPGLPEALTSSGNASPLLPLPA